MAINISRKRGRAGQFISSTGPTESDVESKSRRKHRKLQNQETGSRPYDLYLDACFLRGTKKDWVMSDSQVGPLADIALQLFKKSFLPHMQERCTRTRNRFFNFKDGVKQEHIKQEFIRDGNNPRGKRRRKRIFTWWRLPKLGWTSEMDRVYKFVDDAITAKALRVSKEEARKIIRDELLSCNTSMEKPTTSDTHCHTKARLRMESLLVELPTRKYQGTVIPMTYRTFRSLSSSLAADHRLLRCPLPFLFAHYGYSNRNFHYNTMFSISNDVFPFREWCATGCRELASVVKRLLIDQRGFLMTQPNKPRYYLFVNGTRRKRCRQRE